MTCLLSLAIVAVLLIVQLRRDAEYRKIHAKTVLVLQLCVDENIRHQKQLVDLISRTHPHLRPQVDAILNDSQAHNL